MSAVIADALIAAICDLADVHPDGRRETGANGTLLLISGSQLSSLNGVFVIGDAPDIAEIDRLAVEAATIGLPWSIAVRGEPGAAVREVAARHGRTGRHETPVMVCPDRPAKTTGDGTVRAIRSDEGRVFCETMAAGFEAPAEIILSLMTDELIDAPWAASYLVEAGGVPVATGLGILSGDYIGVYNIATLPEHRGRGYGRLVTERTIADGFAAGATKAYLQSSSMGKPLYESMGFRTVETWTYLT
jgi:GNAT superfamily N-acetyltransferase